MVLLRGAVTKQLGETRDLTKKSLEKGAFSSGEKKRVTI